MDVILPAQVHYMIESLLNTRDNVWQRQPFQGRLIAIRDKIDEAIRKFEAEYKKAAVEVNKKGKKK